MIYNDKEMNHGMAVDHIFDGNCCSISRADIVAAPRGQQ